MTEASELAEAKIAEAAHAMAVAHEATSNAREAQMHDTLYNVFREILTAGDEGTKKLLIQKIPLLCTDVMSMKKAVDELVQVIAEMKSTQDKQSSDMVWIKWIGMGFVVTAGLLALKQLGV